MNISIVTISFNQRKFLPECLASVQGQLISGDEHIVVDPGSKDGSRELLLDYARAHGNVTLVFDPDNGPSDGLNHGFKKATCPIFCYINADDFLLPGAFHFVRGHFSRHKSLDVLIGGIKIADSEGNLRLRGRVADNPSKLRLACGVMQYYQQGTFFKSEVYTSIGGFNIYNRTCWDRELIVDSALLGHNIHVLAKPLAAFRLHSDSITGSGTNRERYRNDLLRINEKINSALRFTPSRLHVMTLVLEAKLNPIRFLRQLA